MKKVKLLLAAALSMIAWTGVLAQTAVTDVSQLSNTKVYTIVCPRGTLTLNNAQTALVSSHKSTMATVNDAAATDEASMQFCIVKVGDYYYIYSPKLKMFAGLMGQEVNFTAHRHVPFTITTDGKDGVDGSVFRLKATFNSYNYYVNNNNSGGIVLNSYSTPEGGNTMTFYEVDGASVDEAEVLSALRTEYLDEHKVYKINNLRVTTWTANADGTGLTGTKAYSAAPEAYQEFAFIKRDGKFYMYNVGAKKFVGFEGDSPVLTGVKAQFTPVDYFETTNATYPFKFYLPAKNWYFNGQGGGGFAINDWSAEDDGNRHDLVEVAGADVYDEMLDFFEAPYWDVTYKVYYNGNLVDNAIVYTKKNSPAELPAANRKSFTSYTYSPATIEAGVTEVTVTATWDGPFEISTDFASAHWYDMAMRSTWYVTSAVKETNTEDQHNGYGAYKTQNANTLGLVEDSYQWAFIGNGYDGFKIINKAEGDGKSFGWTDETATNKGIPTIMADGEGHHLWKIVPSTNTTVPAGSFCLNVPGTALYINQFGGPGGNMQFWNSTNNLGDDGSAFTVFDVPSNFASFVVDEIAPAMEATGYFALKDAVKASIGWDPAYTTDCPFETYKTLKENLAAVDLTDLSNFVLPETGFYLLKNKYYGTYMGIDPSDANMYGNYAAAKAAKQIVKLTKNADNTYTIGLMGKFAPATVAQSQPVTASTDAANYTVVITTPGYAAFQANPSVNMSCLHCRAAGDIVGWEAPADASKWEAIDAEGEYIDLTVGETGYATAYLPFPVAIPEGVTAYTAVIATNTNNGSEYLALNEVLGTIPALTAVILKADANTYEFMVGEVPADGMKIYEDEVDGSNALVKGFAETLEENVLKGTLEPIDALGKYVLANKDKDGNDVPLAFYLAESGKIAAGKAYLELPETVDVKAFYFLLPGEDPTGIANVETVIENGTIYNVAGQRIQKMQRGINIVNGKKVAVK